MCGWVYVSVCVCMCSLGDVELTSGVYRWRVRLDVDGGASTCVGVGRVCVLPPSPFPFGRTAPLWYYRSYRGRMYTQGKEGSVCVSPFSEPGSVVEVRRACWGQCLCVCVRER